jgi:hypothetical protein
MPLIHGFSPFAIFPHAISKKGLRKSPKPAERNSSKEAVAEINAYIAIRDLYLAEAEEVTTDTTLYRARVANDLVATYLKPARSPYEAQHLPEADAVGERKRCEVVKVRIADLACAAVSASERAGAGLTATAPKSLALPTGVDGQRPSLQI